MKRIFYFSVVIILIFSSASSCGDTDGHEFITIQNNSDTDLFVAYTWVERSEIATDTLFQCGVPVINIKAKESTNLKAHNDIWEKDLEDEFPFIIQLIFYDKDTPLQKECNDETIKNLTEQHQKQRVVLSQELLESLNWVITYR